MLWWMAALPSFSSCWHLEFSPVSLILDFWSLRKLKIFCVLIFSWEYQEGKDCRNALTVLWSPFPQEDARRKRPCLIHWCFQKEPARCLPSIGLVCLIKPCWISEVSWEKLRHKRMISHGLKWHTSFPLPCLVFQRRNLDPCSFFFLIGDPSVRN